MKDLLRKHLMLTIILMMVLTLLPLQSIRAEDGVTETADDAVTGTVEVLSDEQTEEKADDKTTAGVPDEKKDDVLPSEDKKDEETPVKEDLPEEEKEIEKKDGASFEEEKKSENEGPLTEAEEKTDDEKKTDEEKDEDEPLETVSTYQYTLYYDVNGGDASSTPLPSVSEVIESTTYTVAVTEAKPQKSGAVFLGWASGPDATAVEYSANDDYTFNVEASESTETVNVSATLYAVWQNTYTYKFIFNANGGSGGPGTVTFAGITADTYSYTIPNVQPTRGSALNRYIFAGWANTSNASNADYQVGDVITMDSQNSSKTLYAVWKRTGTNYTLRYNANAGGDTVTNMPATCVEYDGSLVPVYHDFTISALTPQREGYFFLGWATRSSATTAEYEPGDTYRAYVTSTTSTLYAVWKKVESISYTLHYNANGGSMSPEDATDGPHEVVATSYTFSITSAVPVRSGYRFLGWSATSPFLIVEYRAGNTLTLEAGAQDTSVSRTLYAVWQRVYPYTLYLDPNSGSGGTQKIRIEDPSIISADIKIPNDIELPVKPGYDFQGWADTDYATEGYYLPGNTLTVLYLTGSRTIYAVWKVRNDTPYTIESYYMLPDGTYADEPDSEFTRTRTGTTDKWANTIAIDHTPQKDGYTYDLTNPDNVNGGYIAGDGSTVLKVYFKLMLTVTYTDGLNGEIFEDEVTKWMNYNSNTPSFKGSVDRDGYVFKGWVKSSDPEAGPGAVDDRVTCNETYTAYWNKICTVTYKLNGGTIDGQSEDITQEYEEGDTVIVLGKPQRNGYEFVRWDGAGVEPGSEYIVSDDVVFTAVWRSNQPDPDPGTNPGTDPGTGPVTPVVPGDPSQEQSYVPIIEPDNTDDKGSEPVPQDTDIIPDETAPETKPEGENAWSVLNVIMTGLTVLAAALSLLAKDGKGSLKIGGVITGIASIVALFLTEKFNGAMKAADKWTPLMAIIMAIGAVIAYFTRKKK